MTKEQFIEFCNVYRYKGSYWDRVEDLGSGTCNILKYAPLYYPDYRIGISNGQQFVFAITYANLALSDMREIRNRAIGFC